MKKLPLIKKLQEDAVGGGSVAMAATPLFATLVKRSKGPRVKVKKMNVGSNTNVSAKKVMGVKESFNNTLANATTKVSDDVEQDSVGIIDKLKNLETKEKADTRDFATFGLEDGDGNVVKVSVPKDEASDFEAALQSALNGDNDDVEIAEVLFDLKDRFTILDVEWGDMEEDEEVEPVEPEAGLEGDGEAALDDLDVQPEAGPGTDEVSSLLTQIIDMMKADAEARKSEALARQAESRAKEAEAAAQQAAIKVKQEEQILDMESHEKKQKDIDKEAKRLAKLAKWRHDMADQEGIDDSDVDEIVPPYTDEPKQTENEERTINAVKRVTPSELASLLLKRT